MSRSRLSRRRSSSFSTMFPRPRTFILVKVWLMLLNARVEGQSYNQFSYQSNSLYSGAVKRVELIQQIQGDIQTVNAKQEHLKREKHEVEEATCALQAACRQEVAALIQQHKSLFATAEGNVKYLEELTQRILKEENEHVRLDNELKSAKDLFELWKLKYEVLLGEVQLMENRRANGTLERCKVVTAEETAKKRLEVQTRGAIYKRIMLQQATSTKVQKMELRIQESQLNQRLGENNHIQEVIDSAKRELQRKREDCEKMKVNAQELLENTRVALKTSEDSKAVLERDLKSVEELSAAMRAHTQEMRAAIKDLRDKTMQLQRVLEGFREDAYCYVRVDKYD